MLAVRAPAVAALFVLLTLAAFACGGGDETVEGVIVDVESSSLTELESFTLRSNEGETLVFVSDPNAPSDPQEGIFPGHLLGHMQAAEHVTVYYREEQGELLAIRLEHE